ncbi:MAG: DUF2905 domain-containing protein [Acidobacteriota bacterium]|nr:DUF2905 domain-containing protein [Acidobacteriota bacterium]
MPGGASADAGKLLLIVGIVIAAAGVALIISARFQAPWLGRLPGDIALHGKHGSFYFPIVTCLVASAVLTLILWGISTILKR